MIDNGAGLINVPLNKWYKLGQSLDRARLYASETVQLENAAQLVEDVHLDDAALGEPFGET